jgi:hypothetical protein
MFENEMTFVKIYSKESELSAIRRYASLKNYIRDRNRRERLNDLEEAPTPRERLNDLEEASTPPFEKGKDKNVRQKTENKNNVSHNSTLGGSISSSMPNNYTAVTDAASIQPLSKRKKVKNSKTTSASQQNALSSSDSTPRRMKEDKKSSKSSNVVENSNNVKKKHLYTSLKPKFLRKNTSSRISKTGGGGVIEFLPSDVRSLRKQLTYLIGEYRAGNRSLKNKIAAILKNLHNRKVMTKREYDTQINSIFVGDEI